MSILATIRRDVEDQFHTIHYEEALTPGTLAHVTATAWAEDATEEAAQEAVAAFITHKRDHRVWRKSARFGLLLDCLHNLPEFQADRDVWAQHTGQEVADYAADFRSWSQMGDHLNHVTVNPVAAVEAALRAGNVNLSEYDVQALTEACYGDDSMGAHVLIARPAEFCKLVAQNKRPEATRQAA